MRPGRSLVAWVVTALLSTGADVAPNAYAAEPQLLEVPVELWDRPRSGRAVLALPAVRHVISALRTRPETRLAIRHAPGAEAGAQAEELRAWLVAHAVEPRRIELRADTSARQGLRLEVASDGQP